MTAAQAPAGATPRRLLTGLLLGLLLGVGFLWPAVGRLRAAIAEDVAVRRAIVSLQAFADLAARAREAAAASVRTASPGAAPEEASLDDEQREDAERAAAARAVTLWTKAEPELRAMRLVDLGSRSLVASTDPADVQRGEPPRRLVRDEKPLFDLGQRLRANVEGNRAGQAKEEEIKVEELPGRALRLSAPWTVAGEVAGVAQIDVRRAPAPPRPPLLPALLAVLLPVVVLAVVTPALRGRPGVLGALAALLLVAGIGGYAWHASRELAGARKAAATTVAADVQAKTARAEAVLAQLGGAAHEPLRGEGWDSDLLRRPRGEIGTTPAARVRVAAAAAQASRGALRAALFGAVVGGLLFVFVGFGFATRSGRAFVRHRVAYAYALPGMLGMLLLAFFPFAYGIALGFTNSNIYNSEKPLTEVFVGFDNFVDILSDTHVVTETPQGRAVNYHNFYWTLGFNVVWTIANVTIGVVSGLVLALILNTSGLALRPIYRVVFILPWAMPNYITALIWKGMFHRQFGVINQVLQMLGMSPVSWFAKPLTSFATVLATNGWLSFPFMMVISLGALQSIPADLYEAARVDGASRWQQFTSITLPSLRPSLVPAIIVSVIWTFNMFNIIFLVSEGEPGGATEILITQAYKIAFQQYRYGYAAAYSTIIFLILLVYGTWQNKVTQATEAIA